MDQVLPLASGAGILVGELLVYAPVSRSQREYRDARNIEGRHQRKQITSTRRMGCVVMGCVCIYG